MNFTKSQLSFLGIYLNCSSNSSEFYNKVIVKNDGENFYFALYSEDIKIVSKFNSDDENKFLNIYNVNQFVNLIKSFSSESIIKIEDSKIWVNKSSVYNLENFNIVIEDPEKYIEMIENIDNTYNISNMDKIKYVQSFIGKDSYNAICIQKNNFVAFDDTILSYVETENKIDDILYFSPTIFNIIKYFKLKSIDINKLQGGDFYNINIDNTYFFIEIKQYNMPNFFEEDIKETYNHKNKVIVDKQLLKDSLNRIKILTQSNVNSRMLFTINKNSIKIESKDSQKGFEIINAGVDKEIKEFSAFISSIKLSQILDLLDGKQIYFYVSCENNEDPMRITDENNSCQYIHILFADIDFKE